MGAACVEQVAAVLRAAARTVIVPMYRSLPESGVMEKAPGELVTVADRRAEEIISAELCRLLPGSVVVGEEGVDADPTILARLGQEGAVWLVDPIDGTRNFAAGCPPFGVMVALRRAGRTLASWILDPLTESLATARVGYGTYVDGVAVRTPDVALPATALRGAVMTRFLPPALASSARAGAERLGAVLPGQHCAAHEYREILLGRQQFVLFWRTLPWDHAPGVLLVQEAGGVARRLDGSRYDPADGRPGLLVAANEAIWHTVHATLVSPTP